MSHIYIYLNRLFPTNWLDKKMSKIGREGIFKRIKNWIIKRFTPNNND